MLATQLVSFVLGLYLFFSSVFFGRHFDAGSSALRVEDWKNLVRFHVTKKGKLEGSFHLFNHILPVSLVFVVGVDQVPRKWRRNAAWTGRMFPSRASHGSEFTEDSVAVDDPGEIRRAKSFASFHGSHSESPSYRWEEPSLWVRGDGKQQLEGVRLIDSFSIDKNGELNWLKNQ